jgi:hypothetical protein
VISLNPLLELKKILNIKLKKKHENAKIRRIEKMVADELKENLLDNLNEQLNASNFSFNSSATIFSILLILAFSCFFFSLMFKIFFNSNKGFKLITR